MDFYLYLAETNLNKGRKNLKSKLDKIKRKLETVYRDAVEGAVRKEVYLKIQEELELEERGAKACSLPQCISPR